MSYLNTKNIQSLTVLMLIVVVYHCPLNAAEYDEYDEYTAYSEMDFDDTFQRAAGKIQRIKSSNSVRVRPGMSWSTALTIYGSNLTCPGGLIQCGISRNGAGCDPADCAAFFNPTLKDQGKLKNSNLFCAKTGSTKLVLTRQKRCLYKCLGGVASSCVEVGFGTCYDKDNPTGYPPTFAREGLVGPRQDTSVGIAAPRPRGLLQSTSGSNRLVYKLIATNDQCDITQGTYSHCYVNPRVSATDCVLPVLQCASPFIGHQCKSFFKK